MPFLIVLFIHTSDYLHYLRSKQTVSPLPNTYENVSALPCKMHNFFIFFIFSRVSSANPRYGRVVEASSCDMAEFQQSVVNDAVDQWRKRLEACISAEGGHFEHLL